MTLRAGEATGPATSAGAADPAGSIRLAPGDPVAVTGAGGFIGSAIVRRLLERGARVVAVVEAGSDRSNLAGLDVELRLADVRDAAAVRAALAGARFVVHSAALYGFWAPDPAAFYGVNVAGTRHVLEAAADAGCERIVYTGTVGTLGLAGTAAGVPADEECVADVAHLYGHYKRSKYVAEHEVLRAAAQGAPVTLVLPTFPLGPRDRRPTPTGKVVLDYLNAKMPGYVDTSMNVAHVDDLAEGHLLALEHGRIGRSYIVGGENLPMHAVLEALAEVTGLAPVRRRYPRAVALTAGAVSEALQGRLLRRSPAVPLEAARMSASHMIFDDARARRELGYSSRPAAEAIEASARWFVEHGYVVSRRRARITKM